MSFIVAIPARYASTRLPGKPLLDIGGKPMLQWVWERASQSRAERVIIATDDDRVAAVAKGFGAEVCMTRANHDSGTDRLQEVAAFYGFDEEQILVNVQGDEPLIPPAVIDQVAVNLAGSPRASIATLAKRIRSKADLLNPNIVKVVVDSTLHALYFSRAPMPWDRESWPDVNALTEEGGLGGDWARHIGIYAYRVGFLHKFVTWPAGRLEQLEKLEQLRALEQGAAIHVDESCEEIPGGVDTQADLERVRALVARL